MITYDKDGLQLYIRPLDKTGVVPVPLPHSEIFEIEIEIYSRYKKTPETTKIYRKSTGDLEVLPDGWLLVIEPADLAPLVPGEMILRRTYTMTNPYFNSGVQNFTKKYLLTILKKIQ